jgi:PhnB protein
MKDSGSISNFLKEGSVKFNPYLLFDGQCEEAFKFYEQILGGKIESMLTHEGTPAACNVPPEWSKKILHARMTIGDIVLMASDAPPGHYQKPQGFSVNISVNKPEEADRIYQALAENGSVQMPLQQTFWATRFAMLFDRFGIPWMINCEQAGQQAA